MELVADGFTLYVGMDELESRLGKPWMKIDLMRARKELGHRAGRPRPRRTGRLQQLGLLKTASDGLTDHGRETVVGVEATHYSATVDLRRYPEWFPSRSARRCVGAWTGSSSSPARARFRWTYGSMTCNGSGASSRRRSFGDGVDGKIVVEYVRFGVPVDIEAPDDDEVFDATTLGIQEARQEHGW